MCSKLQHVSNKCLWLSLQAKDVRHKTIKQIIRLRLRCNLSEAKHKLMLFAVNDAFMLQKNNIKYRGCILKSLPDQDEE